MGSASFIALLWLSVPLKPLALEFPPSLPEECWSQESLRSAVVAHAGQDAFDANADLIGAIVIEQLESGWTGGLRLRTRAGAGQGMRVFHAKTCGAVMQALALAVAWVMDPSEASTVQQQAQSEQQPLPVPRPQAPRPMRWKSALFAGGGMNVGLLPRLGAGIWVDHALRGRLWSVGVDLAVALIPAVRVQGGRIEAQAASVGLRGCRNWAPIGACLHASGGLLRARGMSFRNSQLLLLPQVQLGPRLEAQWNLSKHWLLRVHAEVAAQLVRQTLLLGENPFWTSPRVSATAGVSLGWDFL